MGTAKNEFFRLPRKTANAHFIRGFGDAEKFFCTYLTQSDDLGRVVVPKEIRRTLRIREGDPLEIFTDREGEIILKKYSPIGELSAFAKQYADALAQSCGHIVSITDRDHHIAVSGAARKELLGQPVGPDLENLINQRDTRCAADKDKDFIPISSQETSHFTAQVICPIITEGDAVGAVIITSRNENVKMGEVEQKLASAAASFLGRQLEQ